MKKKVTSDFESRVQFGNLEANLRFLEQTGLLRKKYRFLEIGSGTGGLLHFLIEQGYDVQGVEINPEVIQKAQALYGNLPLFLINSIHLPFPDKTFDVVMSFDVFEHIFDSDGHLQEVSRVLKPHGHYLFQTPNKYINAVFETLRWKSLEWKKDHCALHSKKELLQRFHWHGFEVQFFRISVVNDFFKEKVRWYVGPLGIWLLKLVNPDRWPLGLSPNFYVKATKKYASG